MLYLRATLFGRYRAKNLCKFFASVNSLEVNVAGCMGVHFNFLVYEHCIAWWSIR